MLIPDFTRYSLALFEGESMIHSSTGSGLRPLWEALEMFRGRSGLLLHDKVMGLAAARLIIYSGIVSEVFTMVASLPAHQFLEKNHVTLNAFDVAANILTQDKTAVCPGEIIAMDADDQNLFLLNIQDMLNRQSRLPAEP